MTRSNFGMASVVNIVHAVEYKHTLISPCGMLLCLFELVSDSCVTCTYKLFIGPDLILFCSSENKPDILPSFAKPCWLGSINKES